jgi:hypothetical protein
MHKKKKACTYKVKVEWGIGGFEAKMGKTNEVF